MEILAPLYLAAAAAAAVPLWLHLRRWRTERRVVFPAIRYLQAARRALAQRLQLRHWLLLAARLALVLLAALLAAGHPLYGFDVGPSIDVDRPEDIAAAERLLGLTART